VEGCPIAASFDVELLMPSASVYISMSFKISVQVKPQARTESIVKISQREYRVSVHAPARAGKANEAVIELLAKYFSVARSSVRVLRGQSSRKKLLEIG
jgi:uncharacterized protein